MTRRLIHRISLVLGIAAATFIALLVVLPTLNVIVRGVSRNELSGVVESSEILFAVAGMLGLGLAFWTGEHVATDALTQRVGPRLSRVLQIVGLSVAAAWLIWFVIVTGERAVHSLADLEMRYGLQPVPVWPARIAITLGFASLMLEIGIRIYDLARGREPELRAAGLAEAD